MAHYGTPPPVYKGMKIKVIGAMASKSGEKMTSSLVATLDVCLREKPDLVHFHSFTQQTTFLPRFFGIPVLVQGHGIEWKRSRWNRAGRLVLKISENLMVRSADQLTVVSQVQQAYLREKYHRESVYIPTGVNPPQTLAPDEITRRWGLKGRDYLLTSVRVVPEKGVHYLIEAYHRIKTDKKLVIAGDPGHEKEYFEKLKVLAADSPNILFTGFLTGKVYAELMSNPYAFILASELEGLPTVLLEAMSYGNCCLASDIPENLEALRGKGLSFQSRSPESLAEQLNALFADEGKVRHYREISTEGLQEGFSWDKIAGQFHELYLKMGKTTPGQIPKKSFSSVGEAREGKRF
jgi:glycosyltransferase involved in cell wall biosynthesis